MPPVIISFTISSGTNVKEATAAVESSQFRMIMADDLDDAALKAVRIADITKQVFASIGYCYSNKKYIWSPLLTNILYCVQAEQIQMNVTFNLPL